MTAIVFYFQVHQPYRLRPFKPADVGTGRPYFDDQVNREIVRRVSERCYLPMNTILLEQIEQTDQRFHCAFSLSGTVISQMRDWAPAALDSFVALADTGCVEFLGETSHHSLAFDTDVLHGAERGDEFEDQIERHCEVVEDLFGRRPTTFRNTELCIDEDIARRVEKHGFDVLLGEGADRLLGWRSPQYVYRPKGCEKLKLLLRSYIFSDDIAFRFSNPDWPHRPLFADTFASWLHAVPDHAQFLGLFMDYETFGEHQWAATGILEFMRHLPKHVLENERFAFQTPAELAADCDVVAEIEVPDTISWADQERDLSAWLGNPMQHTAHQALYALHEDVRRASASGRPHLLDDWRKLTTSDHVYYMCTKYFSDGDVHKYFSPYETPHEAFVRFVSALADLKMRLADPADRPRDSLLKVLPERPDVEGSAPPPTTTPTAAKTVKQSAPKRADKKKRSTES